jgi:hypothetical protein
MSLDDMSRKVAAVMAATDDTVITLDLFSKGLLAAGEDETHIVGFSGGCFVCVLMDRLNKEELGTAGVSSFVYICYF